MGRTLAALASCDAALDAVERGRTRPGEPAVQLLRRRAALLRALPR